MLPLLPKNQLAAIHIRAIALTLCWIRARRRNPLAGSAATNDLTPVHSTPNSAEVR